jgi:hypothetical protein
MNNEPRPTVHANCDHEPTKAARAACRKARNDATDARNKRLGAILTQLEIDMSGYQLLHMVCRRYSDRYTHDHADHRNNWDCADAIANYIDAEGRKGHTIPEANIRSHAYRMFS